MPIPHKTVLLSFLFLVGLQAPVYAQEESPGKEGEKEKSFRSQFIDKDDGMLDMSDWLLENIVGFMPVPIIITEPAVEDGIGLAGLFFHQPKDDQMKPDENGRIILPNMSVVGAAITGNESWFVGGGHLRNWGEDHYRYNIMGGYADINLDWYGGDDFPILGNGVRFNTKGAMLNQELLFRLRDSDWFLGVNWRYLNSDVSFKIDLPIDLPPIENTISGLAAVGLYENLDSRISPRKGFRANLKAEFNRDAIGSDYDFDNYTWEIRQYFEFADKFTFAWRLDGAISSGDVPFYLEPFVTIQGIPAMRFQGATAVTVEARGGYDIRPRWTILGFVGGGRAADSASELGSATTRTAYGGGFRYLIARKLGMRVGLDVAEGPEGTHVYLVMGSAW